MVWLWYSADNMKKIKVAGIIFICALVVCGFIVIPNWYHEYLVNKHMAEGWVDPLKWNCWEDYPIKANLKSMIYHLPGDPYYNRTNASNGRCFDTAEHAERQGFRAILGN